MLADSFEGKRLNAPNDIVVKSDDSIWFTDPIFGINGEWEGSRAKPEQATTNVYRIGSDGKITALITDLVNPNGLAFSPDEKKLYVVEWRGTPNRSIWSYDVGADGTSLGNKTKLIDAADQGALDGFRVDRDGNLWCGWGSNGALQAEPSDVGGRKVFQLRGKLRGPGRRDGVQPAGQAARAHPPAGTLRQPVLRRAEEQPALHDEPAIRSTRSTSRRTARPEAAPRDRPSGAAAQPTCDHQRPRRRSAQGIATRDRVGPARRSQLPGGAARTSRARPRDRAPSRRRGDLAFGAVHDARSLARTASSPGMRLPSLRTLAP